MIKNIIWTVTFCLMAGILQSTLLPLIAVYGAVPDLALGIMVYSAYVNGVMTGQFSGFFSGILLDFLSAAPLGLNAFVRTIIGALAGLMKGTFFLDVFFLPMILCALATLIKAVILFFLNLLLGDIVKSYPLVSPLLWIEMGFNIFTAPFIFALLKQFSSLLTRKGLD